MKEYLCICRICHKVFTIHSEFLSLPQLAIHNGNVYGLATCNAGDGFPQVHTQKEIAESYNARLLNQVIA